MTKVWKPADNGRVIVDETGNPVGGLVPLRMASKTQAIVAAAPEALALLDDLLKLHIAHHNHPTHAAARALLRRAAEVRCGICQRLLDQPDDPTTLDCGGDCARCCDAPT